MNVPPSARPTIDPTAFVAPGAVVVGDVRLGAEASVWFHGVLRGDSARIEIGAGSNVQDHTVVHNDEGYPAIVGDAVTIGHRALVHGCVIEDGCLIGMGAILLSGARIGAGSLIGAGALVLENQVIPPGSVALGAPARVRGATTAEHREAITRGATHYAELARVYRDGGYPGIHPNTVGELEWDVWLDALERGPADAAAGQARAGAAWAAPAAGRSSAHDRVGLALGEDAAWLRAFGRDAGVADAAADPVLRVQAWAASRRRVVTLLRSMGAADRERAVTLPGRSERSVAEHVRDWVDRDARLRRELLRSVSGA